jgi:DNA-binding CsgD family transcriptional regulator
LEDIRYLGPTERESEVLLWLAQGKTNEEISRILGGSRRTIDKHVQNLIARRRDVVLPTHRFHVLAIIHFPQEADDFLRRVSLFLHGWFLAFQVETSHSIRSSFRGLDQ